MKKLAILVFILSAFTTQAKTFWSDYSVTYLKGNDYELGDPKREVLTFEHAAGTSWGDSFFFVDRLMSDNGDLQTYAEWAPRIKITDFSEGSFMKTLYVATTIEMNTSFSAANYGGFGFTNYLLGVGADFNVPGFNYFKLNLYTKKNEFGSNNEQLTFVWAMPIGPLLFDGFLDYATANDKSEAWLGTQMQLKYDIAPHLGLSSKLHVGVEYVIWRDKFGIAGVNENNLNLLIKFHY